MKFLHSMVRVRDLEQSLRFYCEGLGLQLVKRNDYEQGRFSLLYLATPADVEAHQKAKSAGLELELPQVELTYNWDPEDYGSARNFGHLAFETENIYQACAHLESMGYTISRPPRDGHMAFVRSPDLISVELLQAGSPLPAAEPWQSRSNVGSW